VPPPFSFEFSEFEWIPDTNAFERLTNSPTGMVGRDLRRRGRLVMMAAKRQVGKDTRELERSINMTHRRLGASGIGQEVWVGSDDDIALLHHEGTRPHEITARNSKVLRYSSRGRIAYARTVQHPGTEPNKYLSDNLYLAGG
jgi:hypothetical protein